MDDSDEIDLFFKKKHIPSIPGDDSFIDKIKEKCFKEKKHMEIPESKSLAPDINRIKQAVCRQYKISSKDLNVSRRGETNEARNAAIYLIRQYTGETLTRIGQAFNILRYSTVSSIILKVSNELQNDKRLKKRINEIEKLIAKGQRQTPRLERIRSRATHYAETPDTELFFRQRTNKCCPIERT